MDNVDKSHFKVIPLLEAQELDIGRTYEDQPSLAIYRIKLEGTEYVIVMFYIFSSFKLQRMYNVRMVVNYKYEGSDPEKVTYYSSEMPSVESALKICDEGLSLVKYGISHKLKFEDLGYPWRVEYGI